MKVTLENVDSVNGKMTVVVEPADYQAQVKKTIKKYCKEAKVPGFRPGMVPEGLIRKQYGMSILAEEVNKALQKGIYDYVEENKVNMLGEPISTEENNSVELKDGADMTFTFDVALAPEIKVSLTKKNKIDFYKVLITDEMVDSQVSMYRQRGAEYVKVDEYQDNDMVKGTLTELAGNGRAKKEGLVKEGATMLPKYFKDEENKKLFEGKKVGDTVKVNPSKIFHNNEAEMISLLGIEKDKVGDYQGNFSFEITEITRYAPGPLNQELFDTVYPGEGIKTEKAFREKIREGVAEQFSKDADYKFLLDVRKYLVEKAGDVKFPEEKLRKMMLANAEGDAEKVEKNFAASLEQLTWHLIEEQLVKKYEIKIDDKDVREMAAEVTKSQFAQYGMINIPNEYLENSINEMLKNRQTVDNLVSRAIDMKLGEKLKEVVTLNEKEVTVDEFNKLF